jgi:hypothetical protein
MTGGAPAGFGRCKEITSARAKTSAAGTSEAVDRPGGPERGVRADRHHADPRRAARERTPDPADAQDPERLPLELDPLREALLVPGAALHGGVRTRDLPREREHEAERQLRDRHRRRRRGVEHAHPFGLGRRDVDVVHADPAPHDDLEPFPRREVACLDLGRRANDHRVVLRDDGEQLVPGHADLLVDGEAAGTHPLDRVGRDRITDQDALGAAHAS